MDETPLSAEELLRREASALAVDDILALCYSFHEKREGERLRLYLDVLRRRGGERAQFASCLICFDLARQGDVAAQRDFTFLGDSMRALAGNVELVQTLVGGDPYLSYVWELCQAQLSEMDPRFAEATQAAQAEAAAIAEVALLTDADFGDIPELDKPIDDTAMLLQFEAALDAFLGGVPGMPVFDPDAGFRVRSAADVERVEAFLRELDSLRDFVRLARGYRALLLLFYGTHIRSRNIFGVVNERKQELLRAGLSEWVASGDVVADVSGVLSSMHADADVWEKIADVIYDYLRFRQSSPEAAQLGMEMYDAVGRLLAREQMRSRWRKAE